MLRVPEDTTIWAADCPIQTFYDLDSSKCSIATIFNFHIVKALSRNKENLLQTAGVNIILEPPPPHTSRF